jgi:hypothetical protein
MRLSEDPCGGPLELPVGLKTNVQEAREARASHYCMPDSGAGSWIYFYGYWFFNRTKPLWSKHNRRVCYLRQLVQKG